jgi:three-Cys-motif partner protein
MTNQSFFEERSDQSYVKSQIVAKYFDLWTKVVGSRSNKIAYLDIFAGPGRYNDQSKSTPLLILEKAVSDPQLSQKLVTIFNDISSDNVESLQESINNINNINKLKYSPRVLNHIVDANLAELFNEMKLIPTLFFIDPWGYKGLSLKLINSVLKNWGCDCIFFFNYNRIRMGINNPKVRSHMDDLFGKDTVDDLNIKLASTNDLDERELIVVEELSQSLKNMGGKFVLPFTFKSVSGKRTSHHLIFVSKHFKGYDLMKSIMSNYGEEDIDGVSSFEYNPASIRQPLLYQFRERSLQNLKDSLLHDFSGNMLRLNDFYEKHSVDKPFTKKNYQEALRQLESEKLIITDPPATSRRVRNGKVTFSDKNVKITFR